MDNYDLYDQINTTAANWLRIYAKKMNVPLGIKNFSGKNDYHVWMLKMIDIASIGNGYQDYYIDCNWIDWFKFRFFKHFKHMKKFKKNQQVVFIDIPVFVDEICQACKVQADIIKYMFKGDYWRI